MIPTFQQGQFGRRIIGATGGGGGGFRSRLQFGGADASTTFTDDSGKTWTAFGNAQIDTSLGDQRGLFDGSGDYITTPNHSDLQFSGNFKIAFTMRFNSKTGFQTICSKGYVSTVASSWLLQTDNGNGRLIFYHVTGAGSTVAVCTESSGTINVGQDYAIEIERVSTAAGGVTIKRDGATVATGTSNVSMTSSTELSIGGGSSTGYNNFWFNGWIKDFQIT